MSEATNVVKKTFFDGILQATDEETRYGIRIRDPVYEFKHPDLSQNVTDPEHWFKY